VAARELVLRTNDQRFRSANVCSRLAATTDASRRKARRHHVARSSNAAAQQGPTQEFREGDVVRRQKAAQESFNNPEVISMDETEQT
jgi:hypothetical protein